MILEGRSTYFIALTRVAGGMLPVGVFDFNRYFDKWCGIARLSNGFDDCCSNVMAEYEQCTDSKFPIKKSYQRLEEPRVGYDMATLIFKDRSDDE